MRALALALLISVSVVVGGCEGRPLEASSASIDGGAWIASAECSAPVCPWGATEAAGFAMRDDAENWVLDQVSVFAAWSGRPAYPLEAQRLLAPWASDYTNFGFGGRDGVDAVFTIHADKWAH